MLNNLYQKCQKKYVNYKVSRMLNSAKAKWGLGLPFDDSQFVDVTPYIGSELLKTIYKPVRVFSKYHKYYYLVDENNMAVGFGHIDVEGLKETLTYDLLFFSYFINYIVAFVSKDQEKIKEYYNDKTISNLFREIKEANKRAKLNEHFA